MHPAALYGPECQMFICTTQEHFDQLSALGWKSLPADFDPPFDPAAAVWVPHWDALKLAEPVKRKARK